jgi:nitrogen fixation protein FixH
MSLRKNTYQQIIEFNKKTFHQKAKRRRRQAKLPFEEKLTILEELNTLVRDCAEKRVNKNMKKPA